jgi:hypothetical protein
MKQSVTTTQNAIRTRQGIKPPAPDREGSNVVGCMATSISRRNGIGSKKLLDAPDRDTFRSRMQWFSRADSVGRRGVNSTASEGTPGSLVGDDDRANLEIANIDEDVIAVDQPPLISAGRRIQMVLMVIDAFAAVPVFVPDVLPSLPFLVLYIVMIISVFIVIVMFLGIGAGRTGKKAGRQECDRYSIASFIHV